MSEKERLDNLKRKLVQLEEKARNLNNDKNILSNILNESNRETSAKFSTLLEGIDLKDEISYLNDWIKFYGEKSAKCRDKTHSLEKAPQQEGKKEVGAESEKRETESGKLAQEAEALQKNEPKKEFFKEAINKKPLIKYVIPFVTILVTILLVIAGLLLLKPSITGNVALDKETAYTENLNLQVNESGTYEWKVKNPGAIKSLKASGSVEGNGTVKVYIEKDGKRQLIYRNK